LRFLIIVLIIGGFFTTLRNFTTPAYLGVNYGQLAPLSKAKNGVSSQTEDLSKKVDTLKFYRKDLDKSKKRALDVLKTFDGAEIKKVEQNYIYAVFSSKTFRFKDDVEFYFDENSNSIHYRSSSRIGFYDFGKNLERYNKFKKEYYSTKKEVFKL